MWEALLDLLDKFSGRYPRPRVVARLNTVDLYGDGDDVDMVIDTEREFHITITDADAEATITVGDLCDLVIAKTALDPEEVWVRVVRITRDNSGCDAPIDRETVFFASHASPRSQ